MADRSGRDPAEQLDPGSPHMDPEDYRHMGLTAHAEHVAGEPNPDLAGRVLHRLRQHDRVGANRIEVEARGTTAVLTGMVPDRHARGRAEELAREVEGVEAVVNRIVVQREETPGPTLSIREPHPPDEPSTQRS